MPQRQNSLTAPIGRVNPVGQSAPQRNVRQIARNQGYRQQIIATRQIAVRQEPRPLANPRQDLAAVQHRQVQQAASDRRLQHIAAQNVRMVQDQNPNPQKSDRVLYGQAVQQLRRISDIGRLTSISSNTHMPVEHRVGALRALRSRYGIPVTQQNFKAFRQAQGFHQFVTAGKEGDTYVLPNVAHGGERTSVGKKGFLGLGGTTYGRTPVTHGPQTYQMQKVNGELVPVAVHQSRQFSLGGAISGHPYQTRLVRDLSVQQQAAIAKGGSGIAGGFTQMGVDTANFGAKAIPQGKIGTPLRRSITDIASLGPNTITGLYATGTALGSAALGNTKPIKAIAKSFSENDPLGRLVIHGDTKAIQQHPGIFLAELAGGATALDRVAGRVSRGGSLVGRAPTPEIRSTRFDPLTQSARQSRYSAGYIASRLQKGMDARTVEKFGNLRKQAIDLATQAKAAHAAGHLEAANGLAKQARDKAAEAEKFNPQRMRGDFTRPQPLGGAHPGQMRSDRQRLADVAEGTDQYAQRQARGLTNEALVGKRAVRAKNRTEGVINRGADAYSEVRGLVSEGRVAADRGALRKLATRLQSQQEHLTAPERAANENLVGAIHEVLRTHTTEGHMQQLYQDAKRYNEVNHAAHEEAIAHGIGTRDEFAMSAAKPFAVEQMGARPLNGDGPLAIMQKAPRDFSHWENKVAVARDALNRARNRENIPQPRSGTRARRGETPPAAPKRTYEGDAVWAGHAGDQPVRVTGFAGTHHGRDYMHIEGSSTSIPKDELRIPGRNANREPATSNGGGAASHIEIQAKQRALKAAVDALNAEKAKGLHEDVPHVLTLNEIHSAMDAYARRFPGRAMKPGEQAFISHSSRANGSGVFNRRADKAMGLSTARRTGAAVIHGTTSVGRDAQIAAVQKLRVLSQQVRSFRGMIRTNAIRDPEKVGPNGQMGLIQGDTAEAAITRYKKIATDEHGLLRPGYLHPDEVMPIRINPLGGRESQMAGTLEHIDQEGRVFGAEDAAAHAVPSVTQTLQDALAGKDTGTGGGPWTLIAKETAARRLEHAQVQAGSWQLGRSISQAFRKTVLPFSPTWLTGNALEANVRSAVAGWHPKDSTLENNVITELAKLDPEKASRLVLAFGYGHMGSADNWAVHQTADSIKGAQKMLYGAAEKLREAQIHGHKPGEAVAHYFGAYTNWMMNDVNGTMEAAIKRGMAGTQMRKLFLDPKLPKLSEDAAKQVAGELHTNHAAADELVAAVQRAYGAYEHFTPDMRKIIINYTPFGAWVFNAVTFLTRVLPADHPGLTALLAANASATQQYRRENGLDATLAGEKGAGQRPAFLMGSIPTPEWYARLVGAKKGDALRLARYTPFGIATDATSSFASMVLPQIPLEALQGYDFAGRPFRNSDGSSYDDSQKLKMFISTFALGTIPLIGQIARGIQKGPLAVVNPLQPVSSKTSSSASKGSGWLPSGGSGSSSWAPAASGGGSGGNSWLPK